MIVGKAGLQYESLSEDVAYGIGVEPRRSGGQGLMAVTDVWVETACRWNRRQRWSLLVWMARDETTKGVLWKRGPLIDRSPR
ncbi:hypothetical protein ACFRU3_37085 [Streptomyces sp. NPDC056910]|uniref:hypothetical protein n=1 Tax=Streptomyces sp. NPDC056910 TaxID=3345964 RepID=UPI0036C1A107